MFNIVLTEPEIPQNTGNIARTCSATGAHLHIIKPMGFSVDDKHLKRAGLDYWNELTITYYENLDDFFDKHKDISFWLCSTKSDTCYADASFRDGDYLFFGKETKGLPEELLKDNLDKCIRIPMRDTARSLNLANSVNIILYEALRQTGFDGLMRTSDYLK